MLMLLLLLLLLLFEAYQMTMKTKDVCFYLT
jgi:hypothetical protein